MNLFGYLADPGNWMGLQGIGARIGQHLLYTLIAIGVAAIIGIPVGVLVGHSRVGDFWVNGISNAARAIPTLGFVVLMVLLLGTGAVPILLPLTVLAIPPILTATAAGIRQADPDAVHAARGLGMTPWQVVIGVEWPLALPLVVSGLRSAVLQVVATATVAAYAAGGGLGRLVIEGQALGPSGYSEMFAGAVLVALLAVVLDLLLGLLGRALRPGAPRGIPLPEPELSLSRR